MQNLLFTLFAQYNIVSNNVNLVDKVTVIKDAFSLDEENIQLFFIGILYDFIKIQPQYFFNREVENEVSHRLNQLFIQDNEKFSKAFFEQQTNLFNAINLYHHILETYNEEEKVATYKAKIELTTGGNYGYTFRVMPKHEMLLDSENLNLVKWIEK